MNEKKNPSIWWRNIDSVLVVWTHGEESLQELFDEINLWPVQVENLHPYSFKKLKQGKTLQKMEGELCI